MFEDRFGYKINKWNRFGYLEPTVYDYSMDYMYPSSVSKIGRWTDNRISSFETENLGSNLAKTYTSSFNIQSNPSTFNSWNMGDTVNALQIGLDVFNSWLAYQNYREQRKNNRFLRKLGRANYTNAAKAYNENLESKYRTRQVNRGATTSEIDRYLQENEDFRRRLARTTL